MPLTTAPLPDKNQVIKANLTAQMAPKRAKRAAKRPPQKNPVKKKQPPNWRLFFIHCSFLFVELHILDELLDHGLVLRCILQARGIGDHQHGSSQVKIILHLSHFHAVGLIGGC